MPRSDEYVTVLSGMVCLNENGNECSAEMKKRKTVAMGHGTVQE